ncbi:hypothetical protein D8779_11040 [Pseudomonas leptonychotis]|uniref:Uncharacterized protein n=1 Tax=Pseudomonas leptonychotis TaxID=2448482 RepID=A0A4T1ZV75_9PSED|nr:hypothetical protein D8779_11040 [Pseudomonas leptonychotis]
MELRGIALGFGSRGDKGWQGGALEVEVGAESMWLWTQRKPVIGYYRFLTLSGSYKSLGG